LNAEIVGNEDVRSENFEYDVIVCPGYWETNNEMVDLASSNSIKQEAVVVGDTPSNMTSAEVVAWAQTTDRASSNLIAYYYPWQLITNVDGKTICVAPSGTALKTWAFSDEATEVWFAPAGTRRGLVTGVEELGYVTGTLGLATTFVPLYVDQGQRDDLYRYFVNINPIVFFPGRGILIWGQKTSAPDASALDRINVTRLMAYVRRQLRKNTLSYVFQPNDQLTRDNMKATVDAFLSDIVVKRGLYDYATISDETNNTPDRVDRNEMYIDVALKPVKAAEFIYIPIRIVSTDADI
jgi:phage tail sheath protein FI